MIPPRTAVGQLRTDLRWIGSRPAATPLHIQLDEAGLTTGTPNVESMVYLMFRHT